MGMIITSTKEVVKYVRIHKNFSFNSLVSFLEDGTEKLKNLISSDLYAKILVAYESETLDEIANKYLLAIFPYCQKFLCHYALCYGFYDLRNHVSELGIQQTVDDSGHSSRPAPVADAKSLHIQYCKRSYDAADALILFLEKNQKNYQDWLLSPSYTQNTQLFIRNAGQYAEFMPLVQSRQTYLAIRPKIKEVELYIKNLLCSPLFYDLKAYVKDKLAFDSGINTINMAIYPSEYEILLRDFVQPLLAYETLFRSVAYLDIVLENGHLYLKEYISVDSTKKSTDYKAVEQLREQLRNDAQSFEKALQNFLDSNVENLPKYKNSPCYQITVRRQTDYCKNAGNKTYGFKRK